MQLQIKNRTESGIEFFLETKKEFLFLLRTSLKKHVVVMIGELYNV